MFARIGFALLTVAGLGACGAKSGGQLVAAPADTVGVPAFGQIPLAPVREASFPGGDVTAASPLERTFSVARAGEGVLDLTASVPGGDWEVAERQAVTLRVSLDGVYNQDIVLATGEAMHTTRVTLGALAPGDHRLRFERLAMASSPGLGRAAIADAAISVVAPDDPRYPVFAHAPILLGRPDSFKTDVPLVLFYNSNSLPTGGRRLTYTYMFSNEDGGTNTQALLARWGRTVDIDWAYALDLDGAGRTAGHETYQGRVHITHDFKGRYEGAHPIVRDATTNDNYDDGGDSPFRYRLAPDTLLDPAVHPREWVLDQYPWAYALAAKELFREKKAVKDVLAPVPVVPKHMVADPRRFLYVDFQLSWGGRGVAVGVKLKGYSQLFTSHRGANDLAVARSGWVRVAVELPRAIAPQDIEHLELLGVGSGWSRVMGVRQVMTLDNDYLPVVYPITWSGSQVFKSDGDRLVFYATAPNPAER